MSQRAVLVLGAGVIGRRHMSAVSAAGDLVVAVVDENRERAQSAASEFAGAAFVSLSDAFAQTHPDTVVIATPSTQHHRQAIEALGLGCDVLVEKPHRVPADDPAELRSAVESGSGRYVVGMTTRHWPGVRATARAIADGSLGKVVSYTDRMHFRLGADDLPAWYFDPAISGGGVLLTNGVHALDRARALMGSELELVDASLVRVFPDHGCEDSAELVLHTADAQIVHLSMLWAPSEPMQTGLTVTGTAGSAHVEMDGSWRIVTVDGETTGPAITDQEPFDLQWASFCAGDEGFGFDDLEPTLEIVEGCYREVLE